MCSYVIFFFHSTCFQIKKLPLRRQACGFHSVKRISGQAPALLDFRLRFATPRAGLTPRHLPRRASPAAAERVDDASPAPVPTRGTVHLPPRGAEPRPSAQGEGSSHGADDPPTPQASSRPSSSGALQSALSSVAPRSWMCRSLGTACSNTLQALSGIY